MTDRGLMQQALEVLEFFWDNGYRNIAMKQKAAMDALRERLAQPETELETYKRLYELRGKALERPCINCGHQPAKIKTMAQPEQGPVAWVYPEGLEALKSGRPWTAYGSSGGGRIPLYLDAVARRVEPPAAESGAGFESLPASSSTWWDEPVAQMNYRKWQGLTDEEIKIIWRDIDGSEGMLMRFARAIEAKLKEKNT